MKTKNHIRFIAYAAVIAALYVVLTHLSNLFGLASGAIQLRLSEALVTLAYFTPAAIPGLAVGCLISNLTTGCIPVDVILGTLATLIGAAGTYLLRRLTPFISPLPPILANTVIVPLVLKFGYGVGDGIPFLMLTVGIGEVLSCGVLGLLLFFAVRKLRIFPTNS